jgi:hypothetical protein
VEVVGPPIKVEHLELVEQVGVVTQEPLELIILDQME